MSLAVESADRNTAKQNYHARYKARYPKLFRHRRKIEFIVQQPFHIATRHFCTLARFQVIADKVVGCQKIIEILWKTFCCVCSDTQNIRIATTMMRGEPYFAEVGTDIRQKDVIWLKGGNCSVRGQRR